MYIQWSILGIKTYLIDVDCSTLNKKNRYELYIGSKTKYSMSKTYLFVTVAVFLLQLSQSGCER